MSSSHYLLNVVNICLLCLCVTVVHSQGILYHRDSETRQSITLDGLWSFALSDLKNPFRAFTEKWYGKRLEDVAELEVQFMAVPSSYNDIGTEAALRDHVGLAWYQREFYVPKSWEAQNVWIRFASVCYAAEVWINGKPAVSHAIGHLPFQAQVTSLLNYGTVNNITVSVDNTLLEATIPQGSLVELESGRTKQTYTFDFFNYAGIDRSVVLYTTPKTAYIDDISITTDIEGTTGKVNYQVAVGDGSSEVTSRVSLVDDTGAKVVTSSGLNGTLSVDNAKLWWPYLMDPNPGYLYTLKVELLDNNQALVDIYNLQIGIRTMAWNSTSVTINGKPIYLRGFGKHEDSDIRGKGLDLPLILRDFNLIKWIGANSFRTSHYPYAEEIMDIADRLGIMVIDESPAVNTENFSAELLRNHKQSITELIKRDKNRPSVIMWSAANEPRTQAPESEDYYRQVIEHIKTLDLTRPTTIVNYQPADIDHSAQFADVLSFNLYQGWYVNTGDLDMIAPSIIIEGDKWHKTHNKPVMIAEYGADTQEGLHFLPSFIWSEDYQKHLLSAHFSAFDQLRKKGWFIGELIWTYADFNTDQIYYRVGGNKKGIFTRNRQPKAAALLMRDRYWQLGKVLEGASVPVDLEDYVISTDNADDSNDSIDDDTSKAYTRVGGNKKGIFTRSRQPKEAALLMRQRYWRLAERLDGASVPSDLNDYVISTVAKTKDELQVFIHIKSLDRTRPSTIVNNQRPTADHSGKFADVLSFNFYEAWYHDSGDLDIITPIVVALATEWKTKHNKPVIMTEYGADTLEGLHFVPSYIWSEDYQRNLLSHHFAAFDQLRAETWFVGEMIWNFADFKTDQTYTRVGGNKKGIFTRDRQPKAAALLMRQRYWKLANELNQMRMPKDLEDYLNLTLYLFALELLQNHNCPYCRQVMAHIKSLDETRPATIVIAEPADLEFAGQFSDILSFNLYASWYDNTGDLDTIIPEVLAWAKSWRDKYNRTVLITEYGGDTMEGLHFLPSFVWSEDYQKNLLSQHFQGFDQLRTEGWFIGEMVWNFADFKTDQAYTRVGGNKKGLFTRVRQPKAAALLMRQRYWRLGEHLDGVTLPNDLEDYVILAKRDEL